MATFQEFQHVLEELRSRRDALHAAIEAMEELQRSYPQRYGPGAPEQSSRTVCMVCGVEKGEDHLSTCDYMGKVGESHLRTITVNGGSPEEKTTPEAQN